MLLSFAVGTNLDDTRTSMQRLGTDFRASETCESCSLYGGEGKRFPLYGTPFPTDSSTIPWPFSFCDYRKPSARQALGCKCVDAIVVQVLHSCYLVRGRVEWFSWPEGFIQAIEVRLSLKLIPVTDLNVLRVIVKFPRQP